MAIENELIAKQSAHIFIDEFFTRIGVVIIAILISSLFWINYVEWGRIMGGCGVLHGGLKLCYRILCSGYSSGRTEYRLVG